jgi:tetratricopeptide (TPR) repeat protein
MAIPKDPKYLLSLAQRFYEIASGRERENYELLSAATKSRLAAFLRGRVSALRKGGFKEMFVGETPEETKWKRERGKELREELERELDIAEELIGEAKSIDSGITLEDGTPADSIMSAIYDTRGRIAADADDSKDAYPYYEKSLKLMPNQETFWNYGLALGANGKHSEAIDAFGKAVDLDPRSEIGLNALWKSGDYKNVKDSRQCEHELTDLPARIFQHEFDHLNGVAYLDRLESSHDIITEKEYLRLLR